MNTLKIKALRHGASDFGISHVNNKRFYVIYNNHIINFGSDIGNTYIDHYDNKNRIAWFARHSKIKNKNGEYVINLKSSPSYWSHIILWT